MNILVPEPKTNVVLRVYDTYTLLGRINLKDLPKWEQTHNEELVLYRFCENVYNFNIPDYKAILLEKVKKSREEHLKDRLAKGFKST